MERIQRISMDRLHSVLTRESFNEPAAAEMLKRARGMLSENRKIEVPHLRHLSHYAAQVICTVINKYLTIPDMDKEVEI